MVPYLKTGHLIKKMCVEKCGLIVFIIFAKRIGARFFTLPNCNAIDAFFSNLKYIKN